MPTGYRLIGFVDDDSLKWGMTIHDGVPYEVYDLVTAEAKVHAAGEAVAWVRRLMNG